MPSNYDNAVSASVATKFGVMPDVVNDFGLDRTGQTDCGAALQAALTSVAAAKRSPYLKIPSGCTILVDSSVTTLVWPSGVILVGDGPTSVLQFKNSPASGVERIQIPSGCTGGIRDMTIDGGNTTPVVVETSTFSGSPVDPVLTTGTTIRLRGASNFRIRDVVFSHTLGYSVLVDATAGNVKDVEIVRCDFFDIRAQVFGTSGTATGGGWAGGIHYRNDGVSYTVDGLTVRDCRFYRISGHCFWGSTGTVASGTPGVLNTNIKFNHNRAKDHALDMCEMAIVEGFQVIGNKSRRGGYYSNADGATGVPFWGQQTAANPGGTTPVVLDHTRTCIGGVISGNDIQCFNGSAIDADGLGSTVVDSNTCVSAFASADPNAQTAQCGPPNARGTNACGGFNLGNTDNDPDSAWHVTVSNNYFAGCGYGAVRIYTGRFCHVHGNTIDHPANASSQPIAFGPTSNTNSYQRCYGNSIHNNVCRWNPTGGGFMVLESCYGSGVVFNSTDVNYVYNNVAIADTAKNVEPFYKDPNSGSTTGPVRANSVTTQASGNGDGYTGYPIGTIYQTEGTNLASHVVKEYRYPDGALLRWSNVTTTDIPSLTISGNGAIDNVRNFTGNSLTIQNLSSSPITTQLVIDNASNVFARSVAIATSSPYDLLSNSSVNSVDGQATPVGTTHGSGITWRGSGLGYIAALENFDNATNANGLLVKVANNNALTRVLDLNVAGTDIFAVTGGGSLTISGNLTVPGFVSGGSFALAGTTIITSSGNLGNINQIAIGSGASSIGGTLGVGGNLSVGSQAVIQASNGWMEIGGTGTPLNALDLALGGGIHIASGVPANTSMAIYNNGGTLYWNGSPLAGATITGTTNYIPVFTASNALGSSVIYQNGGNIGIGTTSASNMLEVSGNIATIVGGGVWLNTGRTAGIVDELSGGGSVTFRSGGTDQRMVITSGGSVGIATNNPASMLDVNGQVRIEQKNFGGNAGLLVEGGNTSGNWPTVGFSTLNSNGVDTIIDFIGVQPTNSSAGSEAGDLIFDTLVGSSFVERMRLNSAGNLSINAPTTSYRLEVNGSAYFHDSTGANSGQMFVLNQGTTTGTNYAAVITASGGGATTNTGIYLTCTGASTNYALRIVAPSAGANNYGIYQSGGAQNYLLGNTGIGGLPNNQMLQVDGSAAVSDSSGMNSSHTFTVTNSTASTNANYAGLFQCTGGSPSNNNNGLYIYVSGATGSGSYNTGIQTIVQGSASYQTGILANVSGGTAQNIGVQTNNPPAGANNWAIYAAGGAQSYFAGNVGINVVNPTSWLEVNGQVAIDQKNFGGNAGLLVKGGNSSGYWPTIGWSTLNSSSVDAQIAAIMIQPINSAAGSEAGDMIFYTCHASSLTERMRITNTGTVGIGTADPTIGGRDSAQFAVVSGGSAVVTAYSASQPCFLLNNNSNGSWNVYDYASGSWTLGIAQLSGRVGINNPNPTYTLDVSGDINCTANHRQNGNLVINSSGQFVGGGGLQTPTIGATVGSLTIGSTLAIDASRNYTGGTVNATGYYSSGNAGKSATLTGSFTIGGTVYGNLVFQNGIMINYY